MPALSLQSRAVTRPQVLTPAANNTHTHTYTRAGAHPPCSRCEGLRLSQTSMTPACQSPSSTAQKLSVPPSVLSTILSPGDRKPILQMKKLGSRHQRSRS